MKLSYVVRIAFDERPVLRAFLDWLVERHVADVRAAGAEAAEVVALDGDLVLECRYRFASREAFAAYERDHAPRLRAEGIAALGGGTARFSRTTGEIIEANGGG